MNLTSRGRARNIHDIICPELRPERHPSEGPRATSVIVLEEVSRKYFAGLLDDKQGQAGRIRGYRSDTICSRPLTPPPTVTRVNKGKQEQTRAMQVLLEQRSRLGDTSI